MPTNKNQHFLPQHYLRLFSVDGGKNIGITRLEPFKFITGPIKGQCQAEWFYRDDGELDEWLKQTESGYGNMLPGLIDARRMSGEQLVACRFLAVLFNIRTKKAAEIHGLFSRRMFFDVVNEGIDRGEVPPPPADWSMDTVEATGVSGFLVKNSLLQCFFEMSTLHCKLLEPTGEARFVTSDHPTVCMNQLFAKEAETTKRSYSGFSRSGFQLILPLCPTLCLFFYDPKVYKVGSKRDNLVGLRDGDVELLNSLQVQNADACLYTGSSDSASEMRALVEQFGKLRTPTNDLLQVTPMSDGNEYYHVRSPNPRLLLPWSFCRLQRNPRIPESGRRNDVWTALVGAFMDHVRETEPHDVMEDFVHFTENFTKY